MKIIIVTNTSWNIYNFRLPLVRHLKAMGHTVHAAAPNDEYSQLLAEEIEKLHYISLNRKGTNPFEDYKLYRDLKKLYKQTQPDLIIHYTIKPNIYGTLAAKACKIPCINNVTGLGTVFLHNNISNTIAKKLYAYSFQFAEKVIFQNNDDLELFVKEKLCAAETATVIPGSGVDVNHFIQNKTEPKSTFTFAFVGRLLFDKGVVELIEAIRLLKKESINFNFLIAGKVETEAKLGVNEDTISQWEKEGLVDYRGIVKDIKSFLGEVDCVVLPSYREGNPRALLEAASMSLPMVATNVTGCKEVVVNGENGYLCEVKNSDSLALALKKIVSLPLNEYLSFGKMGRERVVNHFSEEIIIKKYEAIIAEAT